MVGPVGNDPTSLVLQTNANPSQLQTHLYGGQSRTRTYEPRREEIYSLQSLPLDYLAILVVALGNDPSGCKHSRVTADSASLTVYATIY